MSVDAVNQNFQAMFQHNASAASHAEGAKGLFMGHAVQVQTSPASILADAAEELGFSVDRTKDFEISRRKERDTSAVSRELLEKYQQIMQQAGRTEQMNSLVESLKRAAGRETMERILSDSGADPTDAWAALESALAELDADPMTPLDRKADLRSVRDDFMNANSQAVRLGLQGALSSEGWDIGGPDAGRDLYRSTVGEFTSVEEVFADIQKNYGDRFDLAMDFLFSAISSDIDSDAPSMEKTHLENVHQKLATVRLAQSAYTLCGELLGRWENVHGVKNSSMNAMDLLGEVIGLRGNNYVGSYAIDEICRKANPPDIEHEVLFLQELLSTVRKFPVPLFEDEQGRMTVMDAVQSAVDAAVEREDEWLATLE